LSKSLSITEKGLFLDKDKKIVLEKETLDKIIEEEDFLYESTDNDEEDIP